MNSGRCRVGRHFYGICWNRKHLAIFSYCCTSLEMSVPIGKRDVVSPVHFCMKTIRPMTICTRRARPGKLLFLSLQSLICILWLVFKILDMYCLYAIHLPVTSLQLFHPNSSLFMTLSQKPVSGHFLNWLVFTFCFYLLFWGWCWNYSRRCI